MKGEFEEVLEVIRNILAVDRSNRGLLKKSVREYWNRNFFRGREVEVAMSRNNVRG
jgi:hypothetical protein